MKNSTPSSKSQRHRIELMIIALVVTVLANIGIYYWNKAYYAETTATITPAAEISVLQTIYFSETNAAEEKIAVSEGTTALELLQQTNNLVVKGEGPLAIVSQIGSRKADESANEVWTLYLNKTPVDRSPGSITLSNGDHIEWKLEQGAALNTPSISGSPSATSSASPTGSLRSP